MAKTICHSSSAELIAGDEDLLTEVLLRLPVRPLLRFKSVSKKWLSLISCSRFSRRHTLLHRLSCNTSGLFLRQTVDDLQFLSFNTCRISSSPSLTFVDDPSGIKILQSCNGLLLCSSRHEIGTTPKYYVCNPSTRQYATLPPILAADVVSTDVFGVCLAFDPCRSCSYKVVCIRRPPESLDSYQIEIYSSEVGVWKVCGSPFVAPFDMVFGNGVYCNGVIHWISPRNGLRLDVDRECIDTMPDFPFLDGWVNRRFRYFAQSHNHLHLIEIHDDHATKFNVFEMGRDYSKWFVKYQVDLDDVVAAYPDMVRSYLRASVSNFCVYTVLCVIEEETEEGSSLLLHIPGKVIAYKFKDKTFEEVCSLKWSGKGVEGLLQFGWVDSYQFIETLACV